MIGIIAAMQIELLHLKGIMEDVKCENVSGVEYLRFVKELKENMEIIPEKLKEISEKIWVGSRWYCGAFDGCKNGN